MKFLILAALCGVAFPAPAVEYVKTKEAQMPMPLDMFGMMGGMGGMGGMMNPMYNQISQMHMMNQMNSMFPMNQMGMGGGMQPWQMFHGQQPMDYDPGMYGNY